MVFLINDALNPIALLPHNFYLPLAIPGIYVDIWILSLLIRWARYFSRPHRLDVTVVVEPILMYSVVIKMQGICY